MHLIRISLFYVYQVPFQACRWTLSIKGYWNWKHIFYSYRMDKKGNPNSELSLKGGLGVLQPRRNLGFQKKGQKEKYTDYCPILVVGFKLINYPLNFNLTKRINIGLWINVGHGKFGKNLRSFVMKKLRKLFLPLIFDAKFNKRWAF